MIFNWVKSILTNSAFYIVFMVIFYFLFSKFKSKTEPTANSYAFLYSMLVNIISLGIVMTLSNPNLNENTWSFMLFSVTAIPGFPATLIGVSIVPLVLMCLMPLILLFHAVKMDVYIGAIGVSFAVGLLLSGCFQYFVIGWTVKHGFIALKEKISSKSGLIAITALVVIVVTVLGVMFWTKLHDVLSAVYLDKRQEIEYWD